MVSSKRAVSNKKRKVALCANSREPNELMLIFSYVKAKLAKLTVTKKMLITKSKFPIISVETAIKLFFKLG